MKKKLSLAKLKKKLQTVFNAYIRERDKGQKCISCGKVKDLECGHFYTVKNTNFFRFDERNGNGECSRCNRFDGDHLHGYRKNLEKKIGKEELNNLDSEVEDYKKDRNNLKYKWYRCDLESMIEKYNKKLLDIIK